MKKSTENIYDYIGAAYFLLVCYKTVDRELIVSSYFGPTFLLVIPDDLVYYFFAEIVIAGLIIINSAHLLFGNLENSVMDRRTQHFAEELILATQLAIFLFVVVLTLDYYRDCFWFTELAAVAWLDSEGYFLVYLDALSFIAKILVWWSFFAFMELVVDVKPPEGRPDQRLFYFEEFVIHMLIFILCSANFLMVRSSIIVYFFVLGTALLMLVHFLARRRRARYDYNNFYKKPWRGGRPGAVERPEDKYNSCLYILGLIRPTFVTVNYDSHLLMAIEAVLVQEGDGEAKKASLRKEGYARGYKEGYERFCQLPRQEITYMEYYGVKEMDLNQLQHLRFLLRLAMSPGPQQDEYMAIVEEKGQGLGWGYYTYTTSYEKGYCEGYEAVERDRLGNFSYELREAVRFKKWWKQ